MEYQWDTSELPVDRSRGVVDLDTGPKAVMEETGERHTHTPSGSSKIINRFHVVFFLLFFLYSSGGGSSGDDSGGSSGGGDVSDNCFIARP